MRKCARLAQNTTDPLESSFKPREPLSDGAIKYAIRKEGILRIIGEGEIGDKARSLNRDAEAYRQAGLCVGSIAVLAQSALEDILKYNRICSTLEEGNGIPDIEKKILDAGMKFPPELEAVIAKEIGAFPKSGLESKILGMLPKTSTTDLENCSLELDVFQSKLLSCEVDFGALSMESALKAIQKAALEEDGWKVTYDELDMGIRWQEKQKKVKLDENYLAILKLKDGIEGDEDWQEYRKGHPPKPVFDILRINRYSRLCPAVIRSSAKEDDDGTGAYNSTACKNEIGMVLEAVRAVLASYYSPKAKDLRKNAGTGEGFGIMIEPAVGKAMASKDVAPLFAPLFSGIAVFSRGQLQISADLGFGGVVGGGGETIDMETMRKADGMFSRYVDIRTEQAEQTGQFSSQLIYYLSGKHMEEMKKTRAYDVYTGIRFPGKGESKFSYFDFYGQCIYRHKLNSMMESVDEFDFLKFADSLKAASEALGARRVEFAVGPDLRKGAEEPKAHIVQSSAIRESKESAFSTLAPKGEQICFIVDNLGTARFRFNKFVQAQLSSSVDNLQKFDADLKEGYVAIIPQDLSSNGKDIYLQNAKGAIGFGENDAFGGTFFNTGQRRTYEASKLLEHFPNFMKKTGRFFASSLPYPLKAGLHYEKETANGLHVLSAPEGHYFEAIADGKKGGLRIYLCKNE
ncbi:MAG: hypothetical protein NT051_02860 [Candidatus Micrarchaeota archaeon]|nr:hypothetical protein [Candidatus Micrarchaeota archaeon]